MRSRWRRWGQRWPPWMRSSRRPWMKSRWRRWGQWWRGSKRYTWIKVDSRAILWWNILVHCCTLSLCWSTQRANCQYKDHLVGQLTRKLETSVRERRCWFRRKKDGTKSKGQCVRWFIKGVQEDQINHQHQPFTERDRKLQRRETNQEQAVSSCEQINLIRAAGKFCD